jgi:hypothetical protein
LNSPFMYCIVFLVSFSCFLYSSWVNSTICSLFECV